MQVTVGWNLTMITLMLYFLHRTVLAHDADGQIVSHAEASVLPYSLKSAAGKDDSGRYTLLTVNPPHSESDERKDIDRRNEDPWDRISLHYKTQANHPSVDEFGYNSPYSGLLHTAPANLNHFAIGAVAAPLPLALMLVLNLGILFYLFIGVISTISAAASGFNFGLPHMYIRRSAIGN